MLYYVILCYDILCYIILYYINNNANLISFDTDNFYS